MLTVTKESKNKILFSGFRIVRLGDNETRECIRYADCGYNRRALIQKNGNVAVHGMGGIFDNPQNPRWQVQVAFALYRLKMVSREFWEAAQKRADAAEWEMDFASLESEAERLGCTVKRPRKHK